MAARERRLFIRRLILNPSRARCGNIARPFACVQLTRREQINYKRKNMKAIKNLLNIKRRRAIVREYRTKRREQRTAYNRHNELHPDQYGCGYQFAEYCQTWQTVCRLREELRALANEFGRYDLRIGF